MKSLPLALFASDSRALRHDVVDSLRLDGEQNCGGLAQNFEVVDGGRDFQRAGEFAPALGCDVGHDYIGGLEQLVLDKAVGEGLGHVAAADESKFLHFFSNRDSRSPKIARPIRTMVAPSSIATSKSSVMPMESSLSA